jgi:hypothetical protein
VDDRRGRNQPHPARLTPSWYGDSVGHNEGDTLVIDTVRVKIGPFAMVDMYGTPYSQALHLVERYRLLITKPRNKRRNAARGGSPARGEILALDATPTIRARDCSSNSSSR